MNTSNFFTFFSYLVTGSLLCSFNFQGFLLMLACQTCTLARLVLNSSEIRAPSTIRPRVLTLLLSSLFFHVGGLYIRRNIAPLIRSRELMNLPNTMSYEQLILSTLTSVPVPHIHSVHPIGHSMCRYLECRAKLSC